MEARAALRKEGRQGDRVRIKRKRAFRERDGQRGGPICTINAGRHSTQLFTSNRSDPCRRHTRFYTTESRGQKISMRRCDKSGFRNALFVIELSRLPQPQPTKSPQLFSGRRSFPNPHLTAVL